MMKILWTILFAVFAALTLLSTEQTVAETNAKIDGTFVSEKQLSNPEFYQVSECVDQDSNESNNVSLFFIERIQLPKPACLGAQSVILPHLSFDLQSLSNLLIDLPPPFRSELF